MLYATQQNKVVTNTHKHLPYGGLLPSSPHVQIMLLDWVCFSSLALACLRLYPKSWILIVASTTPFPDHVYAQQWRKLHRLKWSVAYLIILRLLFANFSLFIFCSPKLNNTCNSLLQNLNKQTKKQKKTLFERSILLCYKIRSSPIWL